MDQGHNGGGLGGGWDPNQFGDQWQSDQFGSAELVGQFVDPQPSYLGDPANANGHVDVNAHMANPHTFQSYDNLYSQPIHQYQAWSEPQQSDYYSRGQPQESPANSGALGFLDGQNVQYSSTHPPQPATQWQNHPQKVQAGYVASPGPYSNPLAAPQNGSPSPYPHQQARFIPASISPPAPARSHVVTPPVPQAMNQFHPHALNDAAALRAHGMQTFQQGMQNMQSMQTVQNVQNVHEMARHQEQGPMPMAIAQQPPAQVPTPVEPLPAVSKPLARPAPSPVTKSATRSTVTPSPVPAVVTPVPVPQPGVAAASRLPGASASAPAARSSVLPPSAPVNTPSVATPSAPVPYPKSLSVPNGSDAVVPKIVVEEDRRKEAEANGHIWPGVPNLTVGTSLEQHSKPVMRFTTTVLKSDRKPLFPEVPNGPILAEILGRHLDAYLNIPLKTEHDDERRQADAIMDVELRRTQKQGELPKDWYSRYIPSEGKKREIQGWEDFAAKKDDGKPEFSRLAAIADKAPSIKAKAELYLPHSTGNNSSYLLKMAEEYSSRLREAVVAYRGVPEYAELVTETKRKPRSDVKMDQLKAALAGPRETLRQVILDGMQVRDHRMLAHLGALTCSAIFNVTINLNNSSELAAPLAKDCLRLIDRCVSEYTSQVQEQSRNKDQHPLSKIDPKKLEHVGKKGDDEVKELVNRIVSTMDNAMEEDSETAKATAGSSKKESRKVSGSAGNKAVSAAAAAAKRPREDDGEGRSSKKLATDSKAASTDAPGTKTTGSTAPKASSSLAAKLAGKKPSAVPASTATKLTGALLPGKRPVPKPAQKADPSKADSPKTAAKLAVKSEVAPKIDFSKLEITRPGAAKVASSSTTTSASGAKSTLTKKSAPIAPPAKSKFASLLDEINEPKIEPRRAATPTKTPDVNETEEEKARRLKKEARRRLNLRVKFRSDDTLVEIREFRREEGEEVGAFMTKGVKKATDDMMDEGRALKQGHLGEIRPWDEPAPVDFATLPGEQRDKSFTNRGGLKTFRTPEQEFMEDRDKKVLMVHYTSLEDIPPTPKSPPFEPSDAMDGVAYELPLGTPDLEEIHRRAKDFRELGPQVAARNAQSRRVNPMFGRYQDAMANINNIIVSSIPNKPADPMVDNDDLRSYYNPQTYYSPDVVTAREKALLGLVTSLRARDWRDPTPYDPARPKSRRRHDYPDPIIQADADAVENLVASLVTQNQLQIPAALVPSQPVQPAQPAQLAQAVQPGPPGTQDYTAAWAEYYAQNPQVYAQHYAQQLQQHMQSQQQAQPLQQAMAPVAPQGSDQLSSILQMLGQPDQQAGQPQAAPQFGQLQAADPNSQAAQIQAIMAQLQQGNQQQAPARHGEDPSALAVLAGAMTAMQRGHSSEGYGGLNYDDSGSAGGPYSQQHDDQDSGARLGHDSQRGRGNRHNAGGARRDRDRPTDEPDHLRGINRSRIGTKQCSYWVKGKCTKGDKCTYRHE